MVTRRLLLSLFLSSLVFAAHAGEALSREAYIRANYTKSEHQIPVRDGVRLYTTVYTPNSGEGPWPIILLRTPYSCGPYGLDDYKERLGPSADFEREGFIFVFQDVRGKYMSEGTFRNMTPHGGEINESTDTHDTIQWLIDNLHDHNARVGMWGISYPGFYAAAGMIDSHPNLVFVSPQAPISDWYWDDMHHNGAFCLNLAFNFFSSFGVARPEPVTESAPRFEHPTPDGYQFFLDLGPLKNVNARYFHGEIDFWNQFVAHPNYDDFWQSRNILPHLKNINASVLIVGGLYDAEDLYGPWNIYREVEKNNPRIDNRIVMGPWSHGAWSRGKAEQLGDTHFGFDTAAYYQKRVSLPIFKHHLKGAPMPRLPEALIFETGANRWREFDAWPPRKREATTFYLGEGSISREKSKSERGFVSYPSDPANPVPNTASIGTSWGRDFMAEDQRFASRRPDVLVFETEPLTSDLTLAGPIDVTLWVSTDQSAADFVVKLVDRYPGDAEPRVTEEVDEDGEPVEVERGDAQLLVRYEAFRGRYRNSFEKPEPFVPNEPTKVTIRLQDVLHTFQKGHRMMIQVQSSYFPFFDRNPQKYVPNIFEAEASDFTKATHRVYIDGKHASKLEVGILP